MSLLCTKYRALAELLLNSAQWHWIFALYSLYGSEFYRYVDVVPYAEVYNLRPCLVYSEIQKVFKIFRHIESFGTYMKH
jgi:hypothetical protein